MNTEHVNCELGKHYDSVGVCFKLCFVYKHLTVFHKFTTKILSSKIIQILDIVIPENKSYL